MLEEPEFARERRVDAHVEQHVPVAARQPGIVHGRHAVLDAHHLDLRVCVYCLDGSTDVVYSVEDNALAHDVANPRHIPHV